MTLSHYGNAYAVDHLSLEVYVFASDVDRNEFLSDNPGFSACTAGFARRSLRELGYLLDCDGNRVDGVRGWE